jgi:MerR family transcriptional regulator, light-induced transcriptional regulator
VDNAQLRIGELSRRVGVSPELLRAWERRYGLLRPERTSGGFRLYSEDDVTRVARMRELLAQGLAASEAARVAVAGAADSETSTSLDRPELRARRAELRRALDAFEEVQAHWVLDRVLAGYQLETVVTEVLLPYLHDLGERWERGEATVAQEHFASNLIRGRLLGLAQGWDRGPGPRVLLACPPGEQHDLPLLMFGLALRRHGWRTTFLGSDTPVATLLPAAQALSPRLIVLSATDPERFEAVADGLAALARKWLVVVAGQGATDELAQRLGARLLDGDPVQAAAGIGGMG